MKAIALLCLVVASDAFARGVLVRGSQTKHGTVVAPHYRSSANHTRLDNYSTRGNSNPYTGKRGTRPP